MATNRTMMARGLGVFGIVLGIAEMVAPRRIARLAGAEGHERLIRGFGAREIASGLPLLVARQPAPWLWARVAGDLLDGGLLGTGLADPTKRKRAIIATLVVAPVVVLDLLYAIKGSSSQSDGVSDGGKSTQMRNPPPGQRPLADGAV